MIQEQSDGTVVVTKDKEEPPKLFRLFVYGTLKNGFGNNDVLLRHGAKQLGSGILQGYMMVNQGPFPAIFHCPWRAGIVVHGEIYEINNACLQACDRLEGVPSHYQRRDVYIQAFGQCYTYVQEEPKFDYRYIESGIWEGPGSKSELVVRSRAPNDDRRWNHYNHPDYKDDFWRGRLPPPALTDPGHRLPTPPSLPPPPPTPPDNSVEVIGEIGWGVTAAKESQKGHFATKDNLMRPIKNG